MWKTFKRLMITLALVGVLEQVIPNAYAGAILQLYHDPQNPQFSWSWKTISQKLDNIKAAGFTALLISPHQAACGGKQSVGYDPYDFRSFDSAHGTGEELGELVKKVHRYGLQIYADMVMNHMCSNNFNYPRFGSNDFHHSGSINNWGDQWQVENGSLFGLEDLAQESSYVRGELWKYLVKTNNMGFDGYRWDAAKHVPKWYWKDHIVNNVNAWGSSILARYMTAIRPTFSNTLIPVWR